jgi:hypothetical protein
MKKALWAATSVALLCGTLCTTASSVSAATWVLYDFSADYYRPSMAHPPTTKINLDCKVISGGGTGSVDASFYYKPPVGSLIYAGGPGGEPAIGSSGFVRITGSGGDVYRGPVGQYKLEIYFDGQYVNTPGTYRNSPSPP